MRSQVAPNIGGRGHAHRSCWQPQQWCRALRLATEGGPVILVRANARHPCATVRLRKLHNTAAAAQCTPGGAHDAQAHTRGASLHGCQQCVACDKARSTRPGLGWPGSQCNQPSKWACACAAGRPGRPNMRSASGQRLGRVHMQAHRSPKYAPWVSVAVCSTASGLKRSYLWAWRPVLSSTQVAWS